MDQNAENSYLLRLFSLITAAALYYLAELVEEYTVLAAKVVKYMLVVSGSFHGKLCCSICPGP